jgi:5-methylcytosine-specific restriction endonuclease McrA
MVTFPPSRAALPALPDCAGVGLMARHPGRGGAEWNRVRAMVLKGATHCDICDGALDFDAPPRSRWAPSVDHVVSLKAMRDLDPIAQRRLALDPTNLRPTHYGCNARRGARTATVRRVAVAAASGGSRQWL